MVAAGADQLKNDAAEQDCASCACIMSSWFLALFVSFGLFSFGSTLTSRKNRRTLQKNEECRMKNEECGMGAPVNSGGAKRKARQGTLPGLGARARELTLVADC